jgi:nucleoside-diphosphate-sugar epimerase
MMGGTRFIGLYLARKLVQEGHDVTLFTRGKADVCPQIPDDTPDFYRNFSQCASLPNKPPSPLAAHLRPESTHPRW